MSNWLKGPLYKGHLITVIEAFTFDREGRPGLNPEISVERVENEFLEDIVVRFDHGDNVCDGPSIPLSGTRMEIVGRILLDEMYSVWIDDWLSGAPISIFLQAYGKEGGQENVDLLFSNMRTRLAKSHHSMNARF
jgi:hypothetical protein